jgi:hypothetical protein
VEQIANGRAPCPPSCDCFYFIHQYLTFLPTLRPGRAATDKPPFRPSFAYPTLLSLFCFLIRSSMRPSPSHPPMSLPCQRGP